MFFDEKCPDRGGQGIFLGVKREVEKSFAVGLRDAAPSPIDKIKVGFEQGMSKIIIFCGEFVNKPFVVGGIESLRQKAKIFAQGRLWVRNA